MLWCTVFLLCVIALNMHLMITFSRIITSPPSSLSQILNKIQKYQYMIYRLIGSQYDYGRLYNRTIISNVVARVCGRHAYTTDDDEGEGGERTTYKLADCLVDFTPKKWKKVIDQLECLRESLLRNDAALIVLPAQLEDEHGNRDDDDDEIIPEADESVNEELEARDEFTREYDKMVGLMQFHLCLSHLQPHLDTAIQKGSIEGAESVVIPHDNIIAFE